jgi:hypothetical protein
LLELQVGLARSSGEANLQEYGSELGPVTRKAALLMANHENQQDQADVIVDHAASCSLSPNRQPFSYEFFIDYGDRMLAREAILPDCQKILLIPPEHILIQKLLSSKNSDLSVAALLLASQSLYFPLVHKLIFQQSFSPTFDYKAADVIDRLKNNQLLITVDQFCKAADYLPGSLMCQSVDRLVKLDKLHNAITDNHSESSLSLTALKQIFALDCIYPSQFKFPFLTPY